MQAELKIAHDLLVAIWLPLIDAWEGTFVSKVESVGEKRVDRNAPANLVISVKHPPVDSTCALHV